MKNSFPNSKNCKHSFLLFLYFSLGCACCPKGYLPCGYPNYKKCFKASQFKKGDRVGCQGT